MDKYRPCPSIIAMFTSDSQHPPRSTHAVYLGVFSGDRKIPTLGSTVQWETRQASFPTGTVGPRVGIFLSPLNTNDGFYLSGVQECRILHRFHSVYIFQGCISLIVCRVEINLKFD